ncbi:hypothetical protein H5410_015603 [Solanum commersonii]|uniref:Uncharacterized protein n=1 Tax=Solanum commersonii TaxID=4109 RepID=A0A9J5ZUL5_SOLCO|nr:hypothetical protein H5410_015603 [Solanum commersonii]
MKISSRRIDKQFHEAKIDHPKLQTLRMLNAKVKSRWKRSKGGSPSGLANPTYFANWPFVAFFWQL